MNHKERKRRFHHQSCFTPEPSAEYQSSAFVFTSREKTSRPSELVSEHRRWRWSTPGQMYPHAALQCLLTGYWMSTHQTLTSDWTVKLVLYRTPPENPTTANTCCVLAANVTLRFHFTQLSETHSLISHTDDRRVKKKSIMSCWFFWSEWILLQELHTRTDGESWFWLAGPAAPLRRRRPGWQLGIPPVSQSCSCMANWASVN